VECNSVEFTVQPPRIVRAVEDIILFSGCRVTTLR
jgi:hypothetical protein